MHDDHRAAAIVTLLETYNDLNPAVVDELDEEPSALEFMRYVAKNRPFVARKAIHWPAHEKWTKKYLSAKMGNEPIVVSVTDRGCVDPKMTG
ncbi:hypothetical protein MRB53_038263 [Persea americana]|nr:hypothetical protein MRB53_038263 [Persea americana]